MNSKTKKIIIIIAIIVIILIVAIVLLINNKAKVSEQNGPIEGVITEENNNTEESQYVTQLSDGQKESNAPELTEEKQYKKIEITNVKLVYNPGNGMTTITADLKNTGTETQPQEIADLKIYGSDGEELATMNALIQEINPGETKGLSSTISKDLTNATKFTLYEKSK